MIGWDLRCGRRRKVQKSDWSRGALQKKSHGRETRNRGAFKNGESVSRVMNIQIRKIPWHGRETGKLGAFEKR